MTGPREKSSVKAILRALNATPGCFAEKRHGTAFGHAGAPDVAGCYRGRAFYLEVKRPGECATKIQLIQLARRGAAGAVAAVVHSKADALAALGIPPAGSIRRKSVRDMDPGQVPG